MTWTQSRKFETLLKEFYKPLLSKDTYGENFKFMVADKAVELTYRGINDMIYIVIINFHENTVRKTLNRRPVAFGIEELKFFDNQMFELDPSYAEAVQQDIEDWNKMPELTTTKKVSIRKWNGSAWYEIK